MRSLYLRKEKEGTECAILKENVDHVLSSQADENCVLVRVKACVLSSTDIQTLEELGMLTSEMPIGRAIGGVVDQVGNAVNTFKAEDEVVAFLPLDCQYSGCADLCIINECDLILKPKRIEFQEAVACIGDGLRAYTALQIQARMCAGETVLIMDGATSYGSCLIQLAQNWGAKVITTVTTQQEKIHVESFKPPITSIIDISNGKTNTIRNVCFEETGGLGVDIIIDNGVNMFPDLDEDLAPQQLNLPTKHEIISSLAVCGRWITSQRNLQIDPPNSQLMYLKCATISYLFPSVWTLSASQQGRYLHILRDVLNKLASGVIKPFISETISLEEAQLAYSLINSKKIGSVVVEMS